MNTTGKEGYWLIVQGLRPGLNDGEEPIKTIFLAEKNQVSLFSLNVDVRSLSDSRAGWLGSSLPAPIGLCTQ